MNAYVKNADEIYQQSFATIAAEADLSLIPASARAIARRIIHACGMTDVVKNFVVSPDFSEAAKQALDNGGKILVDAEMVRHGIMNSLLPDRSRIICTLNDPEARDLAQSLGTTRSAAAVELWRPHLEGALVVVGNAPTALFALVDILKAGAPRPAAIAGFAVGFVGAAESKDYLIREANGLPFATLRGRQGGSAMAAAVVNALLSPE